MKTTLSIMSKLKFCGRLGDFSLNRCEKNGLDGGGKAFLFAKTGFL